MTPIEFAHGTPFIETASSAVSLVECDGASRNAAAFARATEVNGQMPKLLRFSKTNAYVNALGGTPRSRLKTFALAVR